jgi:type I restriction enzyme S subunit
MRLGNVITVNPESIRNGYPFDEIEYIDISSVGTGTLQGTQRIQIGDAPSRAKRIVRNGDTLLATVRPNLRSFR